MVRECGCVIPVDPSFLDMEAVEERLGESPVGSSFPPVVGQERTGSGTGASLSQREPRHLLLPGRDDGVRGGGAGGAGGGGRGLHGPVPRPLHRAHLPASPKPTPVLSSRSRLWWQGRGSPTTTSPSFQAEPPLESSFWMSPSAESNTRTSNRSVPFWPPSQPLQLPCSKLHFQSASMSLATFISNIGGAMGVWMGPAPYFPIPTPHHSPCRSRQAGLGPGASILTVLEFLLLGYAGLREVWKERAATSPATTTAESPPALFRKATVQPQPAPPVGVAVEAE